MTKTFIPSWKSAVWEVKRGDRNRRIAWWSHRPILSLQRREAGKYFFKLYLKKPLKLVIPRGLKILGKSESSGIPNYLVLEITSVTTLPIKIQKILSCGIYAFVWEIDGCYTALAVLFCYSLCVLIWSQHRNEVIFLNKTQVFFWRVYTGLMYFDGMLKWRHATFSVICCACGCNRAWYHPGNGLEQVESEGMWDTTGLWVIGINLSF